MTGLHQTPSQQLLTLMSQLAAAAVTAARASENDTVRPWAQHRLELAKLIHDLRTPIHGVLGMLHLLPARRHDERAWTEALDIIRTCAMHQLLLVEDVCDLARLGHAAMQLHPRPFGLRACILESVAMVSAMATIKGLALDAKVAPDVPDRVVADARRLRQILLNLVANALQHTSAGSVRVQVSLATGATRASTGQVRLAFDVVDTGRGMDATSVSRLSQVFRRAGEDQPGADAGSGSGLGLALCREMLELMGSQLRCTSTPGVGSRFGFELSLALCDNGAGRDQAGTGGCHDLETV